MSTVIPLRRPAYTPMGPPVQCMTPGHGDITEYPARPYPGGRLCERCLPRTAAPHDHQQREDNR